LVGHVNLAPLGALLGSPFAVIAHGTEVWSPLAWHRRLALQRATAVGCVSDHTAGCVVRVQGVAAGRCQRLVNAVERLPDLATLANSDGDSPPASPSLQLLSVTRLVPGEPKGIELVLRALAELPLLGDASYVVVGDGPARPVLRQLADALGLGQRVYFAGGVDDGERDRLLAGCDLFVLPSSNEGFGIVYLEAMAHAKPCLAARVGGAPEVVLDEQTGLLVEPAVALVASALQRLSDPALRRRLGQAGRQRVEQHFTYAAFRRHAFALFTSLLAP
jgi:glycosyltransferase involved in cell wall biosynthesis